MGGLDFLGKGSDFSFSPSAQVVREFVQLMDQGRVFWSGIPTSFDGIFIVLFE